MSAPRPPLLALLAAFAGTLWFALPAPAAAPGKPGEPGAEERSLSFRHLHTGERLTVTFRSGGRYDPGALASLDRLLRDHRTGTVHPIDPALFDLLAALRERAGGKGTYEIVCGYRTPESNRHLASTTGGIGERSLHMQGKAVDLRLTGVPLARLRDAALAMKGGGVGYYPRSDFLHVDTGRVRRW